jgi:hypothetical protein
VRTNANLFWILGGFFFLLAIIYAIWTYQWQIVALGDHYVDTERTPQPEWVGTVGMALSGVLSFFLAFYLGRSHSAQGGELPEDIETANIDDGDPEIGHFSPWSWWPVTLGLGLALTFLGLAIGVWICFIGVPLTLIAIIGWNYEYYRNNFAR